MKIKQVEINNILSIEKAVISCEDNGLVLLDGWNFDDNCGNGAGKTSFFTALTFGIYGLYPRAVSITELVKYGQKTANVHVIIEVDNHIWEVDRYRPNKVIYKKDNIIVNITQDEFESNIKLSYSQFLLSTYSIQIGPEKFISLNDSGKKEFILKLMNLSKFNLIKEKIDLKSKKIRELLSDTNNKITSTLGSLDSYKSMELSNNDITNLQNRLSTSNLDVLKTQLSSTQNLSTPDVTLLEQTREKAEQQLIIVRKDNSKKQLLLDNIERLYNEITFLNSKNINCNVECPHCGGNFAITNHGAKTIDELQDQKNTQIKNITNNISTLQYELSLLSSDNKESKLLELIQQLNNKVFESKRDFLSNREEIIALKNKIQREENEITNILSKINQNKEIKNKIEFLTNKLNDLNTLRVKIDDELVIYDLLASFCTSTGAPAYVMDSVVDKINEKINNYINLVWPNISYSIQTFSENKKGEIRTKFSEKLIVNGNNCSLGALSGGEFKCLSIMVDFAIIDTLESMFGLVINPVFLDEPFDWLDLVNRERVINLLKSISVNRQIWIIDHNSEAKAMFSKIFRIEKRNGTSTILPDII